MLFPTVTFAAFFVATYVAHLALRTSPRRWKWAMVVASYVFYGWWDWRFCGLIAASTVANWVFGHAVRGAGPSESRGLVAVAVAANLGVLGVFKYYGFFVETIGATIGSSSALPVLDLVVPVGISFFTFQALSYVIDIQRQRLEPRPLLDFAVYLAFFPQLVAGPIVRATEFLPQLDRMADGRPRDDRVDVNQAALLIGRGLFKKMVVATYLAETVVDPVFAAPALADRTELLLAFYGYAIHIYADFSGYTDIAIGIALLLGFRFPLNFDDPYRAISIQDFWRRWHMTLSRWLRDYLYIPLGGNRISELATYRNLVTTMVLGGLWHGAAWTFVIWGAIHGIALGFERLARSRSARSARAGATPTRGASVVRWIVTFHVVCLAWVLFRAPQFGIAADFLWGLATAPFGSAVNPVAATVIGAALAVQLAPRGLGAWLHRWYLGLDPALQSAGLGLWVFVVIAVGPEGIAPFIYFQF